MMPAEKKYMLKIRVSKKNLANPTICVFNTTKTCLAISRL